MSAAELSPAASSPPPWARALASLARAAKDFRGRGWTAVWLHSKFARDAKWEWNVPYLDRFSVHLPGGALQGWLTAFSGDYDPAERAFLASHIERGSYVLDIGASCGLYTLGLAAAAAKLDASVVAIEPLPDNVAVLRRNLAENGLDGAVRIIDVALGTSDGEIELTAESGAGGNAAIEIPDSPMMFSRARHRVAIRRLDDLDLPRASERRCSVIKIDVEGFEVPALEGGKRFIAEHRPVIAGEFHPDWLAARGFPADSAERWAAENGYRAFGIAVRPIDLWTDRRKTEIVGFGEGDWRECPLTLLQPVPSDERA